MSRSFHGLTFSSLRKRERVIGTIADLDQYVAPF
jgi:hypothetical protein